VKNRTFKNPLSLKERGILEYSKVDLLEFTSDIGEVHNSIHVWCEGQPIIVINRPNLQPLAKFCLHDQPFGFTREYVERLRSMASRRVTHGHGDFGPPDQYEGGWINKLADLIEGLLEEDT